ncbi:MAG: aminomethyl-transferring glycine dehydrogenase [Bacteroidales bacterium]|nr:aminomethyl-transferring glycine dehydrogenase [Bacteroidales bacterium]
MKKALFADRHIGIEADDLKTMFETVGVKNLNELIQQTIPSNIRLETELNLPDAMSEKEYASHIGELAAKNRLFTSYIGQGWYGTVSPAPIIRNVFENPVWYTSYTPYQAEISQGRLEALLNFQTMIIDLTALPLSNCSLLDDATAGAEAAAMMYNLRSREQQKSNTNVLFVDENVFAHIIAVINTRVKLQGIELVIGDYKSFEFTDKVFGAIIQYPNKNGNIEDYTSFISKAQAVNAKVAVAADLLSLALLTPPGEWGADIAFGSTQRMGIPMFNGGPSAAYFATKDENKRSVPGRIIGISKDINDKPALRMALQTREQHIKREKATSNICTAQALLATMAGFYAVYHGSTGIRNIALNIHSVAGLLADELTKFGFTLENKDFFDTLKISLPSTVKIEYLKNIALRNEINLNYIDANEITISIDETTGLVEFNKLLAIFAEAIGKTATFFTDVVDKIYFDSKFKRSSKMLTQEVFNKYHTETELMRYIKKLERRDISLAHSMISLGSCTMKLNAASELLPLSRPEFQNIHPLAPSNQMEGYNELILNLTSYLSEITGLKGVSLQPNSGASGEYAGLRIIHEYQQSIGQGDRNIVLIPASAHGTNPASAAQAGYEVVVVKCSENGDVDLKDLFDKTEQYKENLAAFMITYPSTHGIFETEIVKMSELIHSHGGQVYMDGANMNAQVGFTNPGRIGADVCHLNLHKTFAIPHGGGGPGVGPVCVAEHLIPFLPITNQENIGSYQSGITISAAPYGSAGVLPISYGYIRMLGTEGLKNATTFAILNANYLANLLDDTYGVLFRGKQGRVGHELILECRKIKAETGISETDIAKRLIDYGFHAPTLSFPVPGTLMIEPTESESLSELNRFAETMLSIYSEIQEVGNGDFTKEDNVLVNAPHPEYSVTSDEWNHSYTRQKAAYPLNWIRENKFWVNVARVDNAFGDRNLVCSCDSYIQ